jgi:hypothetical protein
MGNFLLKNNRINKKKIGDEMILVQPDKMNEAHLSIHSISSDNLIEEKSNKIKIKEKKEKTICDDHFG